MSSLEELTLYRTKVSNAGLARLAHLTQLRALDVRYSRVTASGVKELQARMPGVAVLADDAANRTARRICRSRVGQRQRRRGDREVAAHRSARRCKLRDGHATAVSLASSPITDREVAILQELPQLEELSLRDTEISDLGAAHLSAIRTLRRSSISATRCCPIRRSRSSRR